MARVAPSKRNKKVKNQPAQKVLGYISDLIKSPGFKEEVREMRRTLDIPTEGLPNDAAVDLRFGEYDWRKYLPEGFDLRRVIPVLEQLRKKVRTFPIKSKAIMYALFGYVLYNEEDIILFSSVHIENTCKLTDITQEVEEIEEEIGITEKETGLLKRHLDVAYPISIRITPTTSQRDVVSFVQGVWPIIERLQRGHAKKRKKLGKIGRANVAERNEFIYRNRNLSARKIVSKVAEKYGILLDYTYISKVIILEKKKRNKV